MAVAAPVRVQVLDDAAGVFVGIAQAAQRALAEFALAAVGPGSMSAIDQEHRSGNRKSRTLRGRAAPPDFILVVQSATKASSFLGYLTMFEPGQYVKYETMFD